MTDVDILIGTGGLVVCLLVVVAVALRARKVTRRQRRRIPVGPAVTTRTPATWSPCSAHRPHQYGMTADGAEWVCIRSGCGDRRPRDLSRNLGDEPFDQYAAQLVAETEAVLRRVAGDVA